MGPDFVRTAPWSEALPAQSYFLSPFLSQLSNLHHRRKAFPALTCFLPLLSFSGVIPQLNLLHSYSVLLSVSQRVPVLVGMLSKNSGGCFAILVNNKERLFEVFLLPKDIKLSLGVNCGQKGLFFSWRHIQPEKDLIQVSFHKQCHLQG